MLGENQIKRLLQHCENVDVEFEKMDLAGDEGPLYFKYKENLGWCRALRLVLEKDTYSISNKPLEETHVNKR